jgi:hypothetical protein
VGDVKNVIEVADIAKAHRELLEFNILIEGNVVDREKSVRTFLILSIG